ncbi:MAG: efflux RND transporter periplasmic adaptor subunit [Planctomycetes bacterium]|nr:efflux RND transporter periplasmic adaptor subunit [Planctomycetota bacterium]
MNLKLVVLFLVLASGVAALFWKQASREPMHVSGFVEADEVRVGSRVGGRVARVLVEEGQSVDKGTILVELEPHDLLARRERAVADLARAKAEHARLVAGPRAEEIAAAEARRDQIAADLSRLVDGPRAQEVVAARARVVLAEAQLELSRQEFARVKSLHEEGISKDADFDQATSSLRVAEQTVAVRKSELALLEEGTRKEEVAAARAKLAESQATLQQQTNGYRQEDIDAAAAVVASAQAGLDVIEQQIRELRVTSSVDGIVEAIDLRPGDIVAPNAPMLSILDRSHLRVRAWVPERMLALEIGQRLRVTLDAFEGRDFEGRVAFVARRAEFTPSNVQTPEERSKQVFRIRVDLVHGGDAVPSDVRTLRDMIRPGMGADVWLDTMRDGAGN